MSGSRHKGSWKEAVERGRTRGYECLRSPPADSAREELVQYAIRKTDGRYQTYFFAVDLSKMGIAEDCAEEELLEFGDLKAALDHLCSRGADPERFGPFKGQRPF
ncbi:hypothetical protein [Saccharibacillus alkalitolerans]|uniref:Uncharacterized protein n=1 Tax=Saccharibacillus alkalitolerans TaxID=2705290 RepID=A0ABX0EZU2_9BACL|nr:hypothetical protein [Saccharibacillus alkalitolerans]NGZ74258.1 hypothetical protein [Saccharibacillus alkalitolerans]